MATYAVGDLQGCHAEFEQLLDSIAFSSEDHLWLLGDLINRGPANLNVMRLVKSMASQVEVVLGNHDLHFLAVYLGGNKPTGNDTFTDVLKAPDADELADWLCRQKLFHIDDTLGYAMVHAGVPHFWSLKKAAQLAAEVEAALRGEHDVSRYEYLHNLYGNKPDLWNDDLAGLDRLRLITNYLTRMRLVDKQGRLDFANKGALSQAPAGWYPWYELRDARRSDKSMSLLFGHWAALDGRTGYARFHALDTGCVWGRSLTAMCLETGEKTSVKSQK